MAITPVNQDFVIKNGAVVLGTNAVSSSTGQTGALQAYGGAAIARNLIVGETVEVFGDGTFHGTLTANGELVVDGPVQLNDTLNVTNSATVGDLYVLGGLSVEGGNSFTGNQEFLGTATFYNTLIVSGTNAIILGGTLSVDGKVTLNDLTTATTAPDGSLVVLGGQYIGNNLIVASTQTTTSTFIDNALYVAGGVGVEGNLVVGGEVLFRSPVTFVGSATYLLSTNTFYTDNILELHSPVDGVDGQWLTDDGKDIGFRFHYYNGTDTNAALVLANDTKLLEWYISGAEDANIFTGGVYGGAKFGSLYVVDDTENIGTTSSGAVQVTGGVGIGGSLTVGSSATFFDNLTTIGSISADTVTADNLTITNAIVYSDSASTLQNTSIIWNELDQQLEGRTAYANTSTNLLGGAYGSIPYQTTGSTTAMLPLGANSTILTVEGGAITWADAGGSTVGAATTATNLKGGSAGAIPFQIESGVTIFDPEYFNYTNSGTTASLLSVVNIAITGTASSGTVSIDNALVVQGGAYIGNNIWTDGKISITSIESANFLGAGSLATQGGAFIAKNVYVGSTSSSALSVEGGGSYAKTLTLLGADNAAPGFFPTGALIVQNGGIFLEQDLYAEGVVNGNLVRARNLLGNYVVLSDDNGQLYNGPLSYNSGTNLVEGTVTQANNLNGGDTGSIPFQSATSTTTFDSVNFYYSSQTLNVSMISVNSTEIAETTGSGSLQVLGGASIAENLYVGTTATIGGDLYAADMYSNNDLVITTATVNDYVIQTAIFAGTDTAVNTNTGVVTIWNTSTFQSVTDRGATTNNAISITNDTASASTNTGALIVAGGVGIGGDLWVKGEIVADKLTIQYTTVTTTLVTTDDIIQTTNETESTSTLSGALVITGGAGVGKDLYVGGDVYTSGQLVITTATINNFASQTTIVAGTDTAVNTSTGAVTIWNTSTFQSVTNRGATTNNAISITNNTASTSTTSGALIVAGGVGIGGDLWVNGEIVADKLTIQYTTVTTTLVTTDDIIQTTNETESSSTNTGALVITGGAGIGGSLYASQLYDNGSRVITTATIGSSGVTSITAGTDTAITTSTGNVTIWNTSTFQSVTDRGATTDNAILITNDTESNAKNIGSIVAYGGLGVEKSITVGSAITVGATLSTSPGSVVPAVYSNNILLASYTSPEITGSSVVNLDTYSASSYRTSRYTVQVVDGTKVHITEITLFHDGTNAYINEYGTSTNQGELGVFNATLISNQITLTFDPINATAMTIKVVRFSITN